MLVTKTPLRVSFFGGGSDLPVYFSEHTGRVVSAAIDKYIYICMNRQFENGFYLRYSDSEKVSNIDEIRHRIFRASLGLFPATKDVEITSLADIPSYGAGLGSSSSFTVGLLKLLAEYTGIALGHRELAQMACKVELEILKEPIGLQDQYAAAYGGMNNFEFFKNSVRVTPISLSADFQSRLNSSFLLIFTGGTRSASQELKGQQDRISASNQAKNVISSFVQYAESFFKMMLGR